ncbi:hypothetical protein OE749_14515 [Aestuariibacter sp. AA17]|uniref:Uncharacterized protein n=1 Tax=Fluctibacter corallii TaxID=2984329 RepID=A0ABT3ABB7_9ALTE|nr:hypothetical protein [Aestuariibacter sp. AA17]MCV2885909.1 hypothetical protein [Aestuariibacter sp. AA17]
MLPVMDSVRWTRWGKNLCMGMLAMALFIALISVVVKLVVPFVAWIFVFLISFFAMLIKWVVIPILSACGLYLLIKHWRTTQQTR